MPQEFGPESTPLSHILSGKPLICGPGATVAEVARSMRGRGVACALVVDVHGSLMGIFTERDLLNRVVAVGLDPVSVRVVEAMTQGVRCLRADMTANDAGELLARAGFRHAPVVDEEGNPVGVVRMRDLFSLRLREAEARLASEHSRLEDLRRLMELPEEERTRELVAINARLELLALTDPMTGLHNHRYFDQRLREECARCDRLGVSIGLLMLDLDHFKRVNDTHGHPAGDAVLRHLAGILRAAVGGVGGQGMRRSDVLARYGGEEFAVLLPGATTEGAAVVAERVRMALNSTEIIVPDGSEITVTVSIGAASVPHSAVGPEDLLAAADSALYAAKAAGRNRVMPAAPLLLGDIDD